MAHTEGRNLEGVNDNDASNATRTGDTFAVDLTWYLLARLGLVIVLTTVLVLANVPLLVALAIAIVMSMPLGLLLFRRLNRRVTAGLAARGERRKAERARLRAELAGSREPDPGVGEDDERADDDHHSRD